MLRNFSFSTCSAIVACFVWICAPLAIAYAGSWPVVDRSEDAPLVHQAASKLGGSIRTRYTCSGLECFCTQGDDCDAMFESGMCGDVTTCDDSAGTCKCLILKKNKTGSGMKKPPPVMDRKPVLKTQ